MTKTSESQRRASAKWDAKNRKRKNYIVKRSTARNFIKNMDREDYPEFKELIEEKGKEFGENVWLILSYNA